MNLSNLKPTPDWLAIDPADVLRRKCNDVTFPLSDELKELVIKMQLYVDACYNEKDQEYGIKSGIAIAAPQLKMPYNIIYVHFEEKINDDNDSIEHKYLLANPKIIGESVMLSYLKSGEGCLSVNEKYLGYVYRKKKIIIKAFDLIMNKEITVTMDNLLSICVQHEIDHLNGILFYDRINKNNPYEEKQNSIGI